MTTPPQTHFVPMDQQKRLTNATLAGVTAATIALAHGEKEHALVAGALTAAAIYNCEDQALARAAILSTTTAATTSWFTRPTIAQVTVPAASVFFTAYALEVSDWMHEQQQMQQLAGGRPLPQRRPPLVIEHFGPTVNQVHGWLTKIFSPPETSQ